METLGIVLLVVLVYTGIGLLTWVAHRGVY